MEVLKPPPKLKVAEWADRYRVVAKKNSADSGRWKTALVPASYGPYEAVTDRDTRTITIVSATQMLKALDVATPIPTPSGWTTMGDVEVGDQLFDEQGAVCTVIAATEWMQRDRCLEITFGDGAKIVCDDGHRWAVYDSLLGRDRVVTAEEILRTHSMMLGERYAIRPMRPARFAAALGAATAFKGLGVPCIVERAPDNSGLYTIDALNQRRVIVSVDVVEARPVKCIAVDSPNRLYLCGREMIPTHNTELLLNVMGYFIHQDPASILFIQPTQGLAQSFSKERFAPTRESTPILRELIPDPKSRDSGVTIDHKEYPGGTLDFVGANAPGDLASRPKRIVLADEIDKYPASAGSEGDPLALGEERASSFWNRKLVRTCSPTAESTSRIWKEYLLSDQRKLFVSCPHCDHEQVMEWSESTVIWDKDEDGNHLPETARYHCASCGKGWSEAERKNALRALADKPDFGWRQTKTFKCCGEEQRPDQWNERGRSLCKHCGSESRYEGHAGFQVGKLNSIRHPLEDVVREFLSAKSSPQNVKKWINTALAMPTREEFEDTDPRTLRRRVEPYSARAVPAAIKFVTVGVDTQDDRLEGTWLGWGADEEIWVLKHEVINGNPGQLEVWGELDELLREPLDTEDGRKLNVQATGIDSQGHFGEMVHRFCRERKRRRIYALAGRGNDARGSKLIWPKTPSRTKNSGDRLYFVGVDTAKDDLFTRLRIIPDDFEPTPNAVHFPQEGLSRDYFEQLTAEIASIETRNGVSYRRWKIRSDKARNEALDCFVYAMAARHSLPTKTSRAPAWKPLTMAAIQEGEQGEVGQKAKKPTPVQVPAEIKPKRAPDVQPGRVIQRNRPGRRRWNAYA